MLFFLAFDLIIIWIAISITKLGYIAMKTKQIKTNFGKDLIKGDVAVKRGRFFFWIGLFILAFNLFLLLEALF